MVRTWTLAAVGLLAFAVLIWFAGPLLTVGGQAPLGPPLVRVAVILIFAAQYLAQKLWAGWRARRKNERMVAELAPDLTPAVSAEAAQLRERFASALQTLRRTRFSALRPFSFGRSYLYQLPWYLIIGAPGAGKTTALLNSGLKFPLADKLGRDPVAGFGGTRNCDWWFTDRAVLIDTAGRYTTQDSDPAVDRRAWQQFLDLLLRARPRRPLDGILVAISVGDLLDFTPAQRAEHASVLRARVDELQTALRVQLPVYVMLTKTDLLPGFMDWFSDLGREERDQVWGVTVERSAPATGGAAGFAESFERLVDRLADGLVARLQAERDGQRRARIFSLPGALRALGVSLDSMLRDAVGATTQLRGVYLTSGTQTGTPIDRMLLALGRELGLERQILPPNQTTGKSFFLSGPLRDVVLADAATDARAARGARAARVLLASCVIALQLGALALGAWWAAGYWRSGREIARLEDEVSRVSAIVAAVPQPRDPGSGDRSGGASDPRPLLRALAALRALQRTSAAADGSRNFADVGAAARNKLAAAAGAAYDRMLLGPFQQRIAAAIDTSLRAGADVKLQYEALKAHEMLTDARHFNAAGLKVFVMSYWDAVLTPPLTSAERAALADHVQALLKAGAVGSGLRSDPALVDSVRSRLNFRSNAQRIALRLAALSDAHPVAGFEPLASIAGASALLVAADGRTAPGAVPGRYTLDAYRDLVSRDLPAIAVQLNAEAPWVLGASKTDAGADAEEFLASYRIEYAQAWAHWLDDLHLKPAATEAEAIRQERGLGDPAGPLRPLLEMVVRQTPLRLADGTPGPIAAADATADRFAELAALVTRDNQGASPLDGPLLRFRELRVLRTRAADPATEDPAALVDRLARIAADAKQDPEPLRSMLLTLSAPPTSDAFTREFHGSPAALSRLIGGRLGVACIELIAGHFPFDRRAERDASLQDFSRLFGPKGAFDSVFKRLLASRIDTSGDTWQVRNAAAGPDGADVERFRSAARIRDVLFSHGALRPSFQMTFRPLDLDPDIDRFELEIDGQTVRYAHGPAVATVVQWPGPQAGHARIETTPAGGGSEDYRGPWALFRLMDHAAIQEAGAPGHFRVVFDSGGRHASFDVETDTGANPFRLRELEHVDCPVAAR